MKLKKGKKYEEWSLNFLGWDNPNNEDVTGYVFGEYFEGGIYLGPDKYGVEPECEWAWEVGDKVEAGQEGTDDYDRGEIQEVVDDRAFVAWESQVKTWTPMEDLREACA